MNKNRRIKTLLVGLLIWCAGSLILWFTLPYKPRHRLTAPEDLVVAAFSPDGRIIATNSKLVHAVISGQALDPSVPSAWQMSVSIPKEWNGPIRLWDVDTGKQIASFSEEGKFVRKVLFSRDGKVMVLESHIRAGTERTISFFDVQTGDVIEVIHQSPLSLQFLPLGVSPLIPLQLLISPLIFDPYPNVQFCNLSPDGKTLVFDSFCKKGKWVILWDISTKRIRQTLDQWPLAFSPDGEFCVLRSGEVEGENNAQVGIVLTELATGRIVADAHWQTDKVLFSPDGKLLIAQVINESALGHKEVKVWDVERGKELATLNGVIWPTFSRDGKRLAGRFLGMEGPQAIKVWDTETWREVSELHGKESQAQFRGSIASITAGPGDKDFRAIVFDNRNVAPNVFRQWAGSVIGRPATRSTSTDLQVFDVASQETVLRLRLQEFSWLRTQMGSAAVLSPDARTLALKPGAKASPTEPISIEFYNVPPDRPIAAIILWPFLGALVIVFIGWQVNRTRRKHGGKFSRDAIAERDPLSRRG
jgi:WD40 repeat protein